MTGIRSCTAEVTAFGVVVRIEQVSTVLPLASFQRSQSPAILGRCGAIQSALGSIEWLTTTRSARDLRNSHRLRIGYSHSTMTDDERMQRESSLIATIRKKLPEFAKACADETELVLLHQDAFAADYQEDEYMLLGMAIKYAGLRGREVRVIGKNRSSLGEGEKIQ